MKQQMTGSDDHVSSMLKPPAKFLAHTTSKIISNTGRELFLCSSGSSTRESAKICARLTDHEGAQRISNLTDMPRANAHISSIAARI